jgi:hypothetical protein
MEWLRIGQSSKPRTSCWLRPYIKILKVLKMCSRVIRAPKFPTT